VCVYGYVLADGICGVQRSHFDIHLGDSPAKPEKAANIFSPASWPYGITEMLHVRCFKSLKYGKYGAVKVKMWILQIAIVNLLYLMTEDRNTTN